MTVNCGAAVSGQLDRDWRTQATAVGRTYLLLPRAETPTRPSTRLAQPIFIKILVVLEAGARAAIRLKEGADASLLYGHAGVPSGRLQVLDGVQKVRFHGCTNSLAQFAGGVVTAQAGGLVLLATSDGKAARLPIG
jgi:hypothetical protein